MIDIESAWPRVVKNPTPATSPVTSEFSVEVVP
jgi:hypothetical protein